MPAETSHQLYSASPASYTISVAGRLDRSWSQRLAGLRIEVTTREGMDVSTLAGQVADQPALLGVLNALCSLGLPLLSVEILNAGTEVHYGAR